MPQIEQIKKGLTELKRVLPTFNVIVGGDLNSYLGHFSNDFYVFPESDAELTTVKKRTMTQGQYKKG